MFLSARGNKHQRKTRAENKNARIVRRDAEIEFGMSIAFRSSCGTDAVCQQPTCGFILPVPAGGSTFRPGLFYFLKGRRTILLFPIPLAKTFGNGRAEKCVPLVDFPNRVAHVVSGGLLDEIAHRSGVDRLDD